MSLPSKRRSVKRGLEDLRVYLAADYSGIEVRMLCIASGDELLTKQFNSGEDVHSLVGHEMTGKPVDLIKKDKVVRAQVKGVHFGVIYGLGPENGPAHLQAQGVPITREEFVRFQKRYFARYKGVAAYIQKCYASAEHGFVETMFGFRRKITREDEKRGTYYKNQSVNTPIQGAAHQLVLTAAAILRLKPRTYHLLQTPVMEVHDELVFLVRLKDIVQADGDLHKLMQVEVPAYLTRQFGVKFPIPLVAETSAGFTRGSMVRYEAGIPSADQFLIDWRKKYHEVSETPLEKLIPE